MSFLVIGRRGIIGSAVVRLAVARGHGVVNVDKLTYAACLDNVASVADSPLYAFEQADICDRAAMDRILATHRPDAIMHLAAESHVDRSIDGPGTFIDTNITGTYTLLEAARAYWTAEGKPDSFRFPPYVSPSEVFAPLANRACSHTRDAPTPNQPLFSASKGRLRALVPRLATRPTRVAGSILTKLFTTTTAPLNFPES